LIRVVQALPTEPDDPRLFHAFAQTANCEPLFERSQSALNGGSGHTPEVARACAIGESLERYAASCYDCSALPKASYRELVQDGVAALDPCSFPLYSDRQYRTPGFPFEPFLADTPVRWVWATSLVSRRALLVPACFVFIPFEEDARICRAVSTGLACDVSPAGAALSGLHEVIERDAIMIMWLGQIPAPQVDTARISGFGEIMDRMFRPSRLELRVNDITTDLGIPVAFALAIDRANEGMALNAGAAANVDPIRAVYKALTEAAQGRLWLRNEYKEGRLGAVLDSQRVATFHDHVRWFGHQQNLRHVAFLSTAPTAAMTSPKSRCGSISDAQGRLQALTGLLAGHGLDVIVVEITPADIAELGFTVVKTLVPGLVDLNAHHLLPLKGNRRLYEVPERLGYGPRHEDSLNDIPHPFP
jgi:ribosomal protein S12 methylthiotransferase accessory factor